MPQKLADRIADACAEDEACPEQKINRQVERAQPTDGKYQVRDAGIVSQKRDGPDEQRKHRQHQRRRAGLSFRDRVTRAQAEKASQHREVLVEGEDGKYRGEPADQHKFQQQAEHRYQDDRSDLGLRIQIGVVGFERCAHEADLAFKRLGEPAPAEQDAQCETKADPKHAGGEIGRIDALARNKIVGRDGRVGEQQAAQRQTEDTNQAAIGIIGSVHDGGTGSTCETARSRVSRS